MKLFCECMSDCLKQFEIAQKDYSELFATGNASIVLIAADCEHGPEPADELVEDRGTYKIYREGLPFNDPPQEEKP